MKTNKRMHAESVDACCVGGSGFDEENIDACRPPVVKRRAGKKIKTHPVCHIGLEPHS
jgi:hypothetical protein